VVAEVSVAAGLFFKDADKPIMADLKARGLMFRQETYRHTYPFGWRTNDPLLYIAKTAWFIRTTLFKQELLDLNDTINWVPDNVKYGRFGNWLENNVDWALSRERFWGTPLPVWTDGEKYICVGSVAELSGLSGRDLTAMDLHRPAIDAVTFTINDREYTRVPEVIDAWFDSGSMPYAQWHYPFEHRKEFEESFPADFICEAVDQTRGWFYSLHAIATMLFDEAAYKNVICLGHVVDANGEKMSKSKGNILDPYAIFDTIGADALRWYFFTGSAPGAVKRISTDLVADGARGFINTIWNTAKFFVMYANAESVGVPEDVPLEQRSDMDRWALSSLSSTVKNVTSHLEQYNAQAAGREIDAFVDGLSNWYVRLSRDRFWGSSASLDAKAAFRTLYECLNGVTLLLAPFMPFLAESLYSYLVAPVVAAAPPSVHLASWPVAGPIDDEIVAQMDVVRRAVELGRQARATAKIKMRQPLSCAYIRASSKYSDAALRRFRTLVLDELNVKDAQVVGIDASFIEYALRPNLPRLGPRFGKDLGALRKAIAAADPRAVAVAAAGGNGFEVSTDGKKFALEPDDVLVDSKSAQGFAFADGDGMLVALDTRLDEALELEGWSREIVRAVQDARKAAGFDVSDRIALTVVAEGEQYRAAVQWKDYIVEQTLATSWSLERGPFTVKVSKAM
jgi:isoleucyl-tRNA synthetase